MNKTQKEQYRALIKQVENSNKEFEKASKYKKIVMVAMDVLQYLEVEKLKATHGQYVKMEYIPPAVADIIRAANPTNVVEVSSVLKMPEAPVCCTCAIGAGMIAATIRKNHVTRDIGRVLGGLYDSYIECTGYNELSTNATDVFSVGLLRSMESAFEFGAYGYVKANRGRPRLEAIYQNLIDNNGRSFTAYADGKCEEDDEFTLRGKSRRKRVHKGQVIFNVERDERLFK